MFSSYFCVGHHIQRTVPKKKDGGLGIRAQLIKKWVLLNIFATSPFTIEVIAL